MSSTERSHTYRVRPGCLNIFALTWNVGGASPTSTLSLRQLLFPPDVQTPVDIYAIGLQEAQALSGVDAVRTDTSKGKLWENLINESVGSEYELVANRQLTGILMMIFVHDRHKRFVTELQLSYAATGFLNQGNKGAVAARFVLYDRSYAFVIAHLSASEEKVERRNSDFSEILRKAVFVPQEAEDPATSSQSDSAILKQRSQPSDLSAFRNNFSALYSAGLKASGANAGTTAKLSSFAAAAATMLADVKDGGDSQAMADPNAIKILDHDIVLWIGDLNYRIDEDPSSVLGWIESQDWAALAKADQLNQQKRSGLAFQGFEEAQISFAPTYKFEKFTDNYVVDEQGELKRTPSYTDRILWRLGDASLEAPQLSVSPLRYDSVPEQFSDHRPVFALLSVESSRRNGRVGSGEQQRYFSAKRSALPSREKEPEAVSGGVHFSSKTLDYGEIPGTMICVKELTVANDTRDQVRIILPSQRGLPEWISVKQRKTAGRDTIGPGDSASLLFEVHVFDSAKSSSMNPADNREYTTSVTILVEPMRVKQDIHVRCRARTTCFGVAFEDLVRYSQPMATVHDMPRGMSPDAKEYRDTFGDLSTAPLSIPKELWRLIDTLWQQYCDADRHGGHFSSQLFLKRVSREAWLDVLRRLDYNDRLDENIDPAAVATCLLQMLGGTPRPMIPEDSYRKAAMAGNTQPPDALRALMAKLHSVHFNVFVYIVSFLAECGRKWSNMEKRNVAERFAKALFAMESGDSGHSAREDTRFLLFAVEECKAGKLSPQGIFDMPGRRAPRSREMTLRSSRWRDLARNQDVGRYVSLQRSKG